MEFFSNLKDNYEMLWKAIIRPPRTTYSPSQLPPSTFKIGSKKVKRTDITLTNKQNLKLQCTHFEPIDRPAATLPCVVYLHGNSSSRLESVGCIQTLLTNNITLFAFDFAGCGISEGEYISLGYYQKDDLSVVVDYLRKTGGVSLIGLWGRSMGAVTALMYSDSDPSIACMVLDSPFSNMEVLAKQLAEKHSKVPGFLVSGALSMISGTIKDKHKFSLSSLDPLGKHVDKAFIPAFFIAAKGDDFIKPHHTQKLHKAYAGEKKLMIVEGDHGSRRPSYVFDSIGIFFYNLLQVENIPFVEQKPSSDPNIKELSKEHLGHMDVFAGDNGEYLDDEEDISEAIQRSLKQK